MSKRYHHNRKKSEHLGFGIFSLSNKKADFPMITEIITTAIDRRTCKGKGKKKSSSLVLKTQPFPFAHLAQ